MKLIKFFVLLSICATVMLSCNKNEEVVTTSGFKYRFIEHGDAEEIPNDKYIVLNVIYKDNNDSVWFNTIDRGMPLITRKENYKEGDRLGDLKEIFYNLSKDDSITFDLNVAVFYNVNFHRNVPEGIDPSLMLTFNVGVEDVLSDEEMEIWYEIQTLKLKELNDKKQLVQDSLDAITLKNYIEENNIPAQKSSSGLYYVITEEGNGPAPNEGDRVYVNYTGKVLNGVYFDTSLESVAREKNLFDERKMPYKPLDFVVGSKQVIEGWDEGIRYLKEGDKATLYIPSGLAYGKGKVGVIPAYSILVFDIELVKIN